MWDLEACPSSDSMAGWPFRNASGCVPRPAGSSAKRSGDGEGDEPACPALSDTSANTCEYPPAYAEDGDDPAGAQPHPQMQQDGLQSVQSRNTNLAQELAELRDQQISPQRVDEDTRSFLVDSLQLDEEFALTVDETVPSIPVNAQQLCALPLQRTRDLWRSYMLAFAEQLQKWQGNAQSPAAMRLSRLYYEAYQLWMALHSNPHRMRGILEQADRLKEGPLQVSLPHEQIIPGVHHQRMLAAARLSAQQRSVLRSLYCAVLTNFGRLQGRRARCVAQLQGAVPPTAEQAQSAMAGAGQQSGGDMRAVIAELKGVLQEEHRQCMLVLSLIWTRVLTCFQAALLKVLAWPNTVGMLSVCELIARVAGSPSIQELLQQGSQDATLPLLDLQSVMPPSMGVQPMPPVDAGRCDALPSGIIGVASASV